MTKAEMRDTILGAKKSKGMTWEAIATAARKNLAVLNGPPRQLIKTADGIRRLTDEERQAKRAEMQKIVDEECK